MASSMTAVISVHNTCTMYHTHRGINYSASMKFSLYSGLRPTDPLAVVISNFPTTVTISAQGKTKKLEVLLTVKSSSLHKMYTQDSVKIVNPITSTKINKNSRKKTFMHEIDTDGLLL